MDQIESIKGILQEKAPTLELREGERMRRHTSFRIGGPVELMALPKTPEEAIVALTTAQEVGVVPFFLGKGSNLLVTDEAFSAFIIKSSMEEITLLDDGILYAQSGASLAQTAVFAMEQGLAGLAFAHGIPGTVGGGLYMNAGAYDGQMSQVVLWADCLRRDGQRERVEVQDMALGYRSSVFCDDSRMILGVAMKLLPGNPDEIRARMMELAAQRRSKQPLELPSAGSTFKRPEGHFAGALIEGCGLKGAQVGGAKVSEKHAGFVVNAGEATCQDVLTLIAQVQQTVQQQCAVKLEPEVKLLGCHWQ